MGTNYFEVFSPWAEVEPLEPKGITPRFKNLAEATIGLFFNDKRAAQPLMSHLEKRLKERFPNCKILRFANSKPNLPVMEQEDERPLFDQWIKQVDTVASAYGD